jgi:hypothetical protein
VQSIFGHNINNTSLYSINLNLRAVVPQSSSTSEYISRVPRQLFLTFYSREPDYGYCSDTYGGQAVTVTNYVTQVSYVSTRSYHHLGQRDRYQTQTVVSTVTQYETATKIETNTLTATQIYTSVETVPTTRIWVSTEVIDKTKKIDHTLTATDTKTLTNTYTRTDTKTDTATQTDKQTDTATITMTDVSTVIQPTTYIKTYDVTKVIDNVSIYAINHFINLMDL